MKLVMRSILIPSLTTALLGCGSDALDPAHAGKMRLYAAHEQEQMKAALSNAQVPFEVHEDAGGKEEIWYDSRLQEQVLGVRDELFGISPPIGRNISLGSERAAVFAEEMRRRGAAFRTGTYHGSQYVAWEPDSDEAADAALEAACASSEMLTEMRRTRKLADAEQSDRTSRSSRSREERAPAER
jgi:hypothetical protein